MRYLYFFIFLLFLAPSNALQSVRVQFKSGHKFQFAGFYQALHQGYYKEAGFQVELKQGSNDAFSIRQVLTNQADFGVASVEVLDSYLKGSALVLLTTLQQYNPLVLVSLKGNQFQDLVNFNHSKILLPHSKANSIAILMMLQKFGVHLNSVQLITNASKKIESFKLSDADAFVIDHSKLAQYQNKYGKKLSIFKPLSYGISVYGDLLFSSKLFSSKFPFASQKFKTASIRGWQFALSHPKETIELLQNKYSSSTNERDLFLEYEAMKESIQENLLPIGFSNLERWNKIVNGLVAFEGETKKIRNLDDFFFHFEASQSKTLETVLLLIIALLSLTLIKLLYDLYLLKKRARQKLELDLDMAQDHLSSIQEFASIGTWSYTLSNDQFYFSKGLYHLLKRDLSLEQPNFDTVLAYIHPNDREVFELYFNQLCKTGESFDLTFSVNRDDQVQRDFIITGYLEHKEGDRVVGVQGEIKDVSEFIEQEQKLRLTRFSIDDSNELMIWLDIEGKIFDLNDSVCKVFSVKKEELLGQYLSDIYPKVTYQQLMQNIRTVCDLGLVRTQIDFTTKDKQSLSYEVLASLIAFQESQYIYLSLRNINERKLYEEQLIIAKQKAEAGEQLKSNLIATMSHEFHTPMNAIVGFSSMLATTPKEQQQEFVDEIEKNSKRLLNLLSDTLVYSAISQSDVVRQDSNIKELLEITCMEMYESIKNTALEIHNNLDENVPDVVEIDSAMFASLLKNLLDNAIKFSKRGKIQVHLSYSEDLSEFSSPYLTLRVQDQGIGISSSEFKQIFTPFYQIDSSYKRAQSGTGMGLAVCKKITDCVGGSIVVHSELGNGTEVVVDFPLLLN